MKEIKREFMLSIYGLKKKHLDLMSMVSLFRESSYTPRVQGQMTEVLHHLRMAEKYLSNAINIYEVKS